MNNIKFISAFLTIFVFQTPGMSKESFVDVSLFRVKQPLKKLYLAGPGRLILAGSEERMAAGLYEITIESGKFKIEELSKKNMRSQARFLAANEFKYVSGAPLNRLGAKPDALRRYHGEIIVNRNSGEIVCRNHVAIQDYVNSVVGSESRIEFPAEALKAQSVLIQTAMERYKRGDELNDSTEKQAYLGADYERKIVRESVRTTWGQTLVCDGRPVPVYFHSCCAGGTSTSSYFSGKQSGLPCDAAVFCQHCRKAPFWKETRSSISEKQFEQVFKNGIPTVCQKDKYDRPIRLKSAGGQEEWAYQAWLKIGQNFGWDKVPGTRFSIARNPKTSKIEFSSRGAGHGVGLCQWGASGLAEAGKTYGEILQFYFPGSKLVKD